MKLLQRLRLLAMASGRRFAMTNNTQYARRNTHDDKKGAILLIVLIVILTISLLGATLIALFFNVLTSSQIELERTQALYLAEAGIAMATGVLKDQTAVFSKDEPQRIVPTTRLGEGSFEVYSDFSQSTIVSIGECHGTRRAIQVKYSAF